ncbi:hypothetical protein ACZ90_13055 [Streptomyces albus subsp. albus]|nr:hypothetical protein ACZ90_13055 [Streptomyces albus subsp. albus]
MSTVNVVSLVGPPGSGKTTQAARLAAALADAWGSPVLRASVPALFRGDPALDARLTRQERARVAGVRAAAHARADRGELMPEELDRVLLAVVGRAAARGEPVVLDSVPRGRAQAGLLLAGDLPLEQLAVLHLRAPDDPFAFSLRRQLARAASRGEPAPTAPHLRRMRRKARVYTEQTLPALADLVRAGADLADVEAGAGAEQVADAIRDRLARRGVLPHPRTTARPGAVPCA